MHSFEKLAGCIIGGAIGDLLGSQYENKEALDSNTFVWDNAPVPASLNTLSDDTQLTLATCEAILEAGEINPEKIASTFLAYYQSGKLSGLGSATLQAIHGLRAGGHWALVGKKGEHAAGNGAAMRIAPLAFWKTGVTREHIRDISRITHHHDEAYTGALAVYFAIRNTFDDNPIEGKTWLVSIGDLLPDTLVRERIITMASEYDSQSIQTISETYGNSGYVVESVPFALFAAAKSQKIGFEAAMTEVIQTGGDSDTNASIMGQISGSVIGFSQLPDTLLRQLNVLEAYLWIESILTRWEQSFIR